MGSGGGIAAGQLGRVGQFGLRNWLQIT